MTDDKKTAQNQDVKKRQIAKGESKSKQLEEQLKRALADYQNLERRVEEERRLLGQLSSAILIEKFLPVLDNLENAKKHIDDQGLEMVINQFKDVLKTEGVEEIVAEGTKFDPNLHEATEVAEGQNDGIIARVIRKGYKINNKVIRPAQVIVERSQVNQNTAAKGEPRSDDEREEKAEEHTNVYE
ncbi:nucleotide exchange factor GrpE [Candidatus Curtissbacteria bacterium RIFCSPHIGHO2_12_41_11]|uniref:Protein GrpE n=3 Tax=Candidatus Curtissiibacteriota TaxID=1752717 RepID=A0A1F5HR08_9BACT|nr:MAG: Protein GrpE [Candidatus Curtissbacteria bacterium GW2011_GWA2_41_24]OGD99959.1 MAG: nucleotide exchange factor GrpE [Candidatus Curtissbacteria bacterium RIFCSPHIGHO2_12_41_11]OGE06597.1 MAG: nucleotide exchange factor GrpE [Candidatus Curtissbacteria bacterium RIFCSPLOWO2_02_41_11]